MKKHLIIILAALVSLTSCEIDKGPIEPVGFITEIRAYEPGKVIIEVTFPTAADNGYVSRVRFVAPDTCRVGQTINVL